MVNAAANIATLTPAHHVLSVGGASTLTAGQDTNLLAQRHQAWAVKDGISLFSRGEAKDGQRAVQDTGLKLHAASGNVNTQAQSGPFSLTALKSVDLQSTAADIVISAPSKVLLNGGGGYIKIEGGDIEIGTSGAASFKASMKELGAGGGASGEQPLMPRPSDWHAESGNQYFRILSHDGQPVSRRRYRAKTGNVAIEGFTDDSGRTALLEGHVDQYARIELVDERYDEHFVLRDSGGQVLAGFPYVIRSAAGVELRGLTDHQGRTGLFTSDRREPLALIFEPLDFPQAEGGG